MNFDDWYYDFRYKYEGKEASIKIRGDSSIDGLIEAFKNILVAGGFTASTVEQLFEEEEEKE